MSAYVCSKAHIKALAIFAVRKNHGCMFVDPSYVDGAKDVASKYPEVVATRYAALLLAENVRSVRSRYADDDGDYEEINIGTNEVFRSTALNPVTILKLCNCLSYQSCESEDWETTNAYKLLQQIKDAAIRILPGYEEAPWGIDEMSEA